MPRFKKLTKPCRECPFKRTSAPGWLGASTAESFIDDATHDAPMPCHMTIDYSQPDWFDKQFPDADVCAGAAQFLRNWMKTPRQGAMRDAVAGIADPDFTPRTFDFGEQFPEVFATPQEFLAHHDCDRNRAYVAAHRARDLMRINSALTYGQAIRQAEEEAS